MSFRTVEVSDPGIDLNGLRFYTVKSDSLKGRADITVFVPDGELPSDPPVIVLLHGVYGSHWAWSLKGKAHLVLNKMLRQGQIEPFILVMPSDGLWGDGSGYVKHQQQDFERWIARDIPQFAREHIKEVSNTSKFYISGLSMGGFGAFSIGIKYSEVFRAISAHSSILHLNQMEQFVIEDWRDIRHQNVNESIENLILENKNSSLRFRFDCGTEDQLYEANKSLHNVLMQNEVEHEYEEFSGGHDWTYWSTHVAETFAYFHSEHYD